MIACPCISPQWELGALAALLKPQLKESILHTPAQQRFGSASVRALSAAAALLRERLGLALPLHLPARGDYHFIIEIVDSDSAESRACAAVISRALPGLWLVIGRLFVKDGKFYRRQYGYKLLLRPATGVHLSRALRTALKGVL
jgi:hypothetical protein